MVCEGSLATGPACGQYGSSGAARTHFAIAAWDGGGGQIGGRTGGGGGGVTMTCSLPAGGGAGGKGQPLNSARRPASVTPVVWCSQGRVDRPLSS